MPIYAKKLSKEWRTAFEEFERLTGFEIMNQEEIDSGETTPYEVWNHNIAWLELVVADATNIRIPSEA